MKKMKKIFILLFFMAFSIMSFGQSDAKVSTTATLIVPISIAKKTDMNFGTVASSGTAGTVVLDYASARTKTGGVTLPAAGITATAAVFTVTGEGNSSFSVAIPASPIILTGSVAGTAGTLTVSNFLCQETASTTLTSGTKDLYIGATLNVPLNSVAGIYSNTTDLKVTVNYN